MPKIQLYVMDIRKAEIDSKQAALIFGRTPDNERICLVDDSLLPYFYVLSKKLTDALEKLKKIEIDNEGKISRVVNATRVKKKLNGKEVEAIKVETTLYRDIKAIISVIKEWEFIDGIYEEDIPYVKRYLTDKGITLSGLIETDVRPLKFNFKVDTYLASDIINLDSSMNSPRILAFDIETYSSDGRIDMKLNPIIMISFYGENFKKVITWKRFKTDLDYIEFVPSELELIERFIQVIDEYQPDIITGYNTDGFDFPYIEERVRKYKLELNISLDNKSIRRVRGENMRVRIPGIVNIDNFRFIRKIKNIEGGYSLDNVSKKLLGKGKKKIEFSEMIKAWDEKSEKIGEFCEYALLDSELSYDLCKRFLPQVIELSKLTGMTMDNVTRLGYSQIVESFLIKEAYSYGEIVLSKPSRDEIAKRFLNTYKGSFVFEPKPGIYDNISVFDFRSLYPSIIATHNISPDTIDCGCCSEKENTPSDSESEHHFCKNKKGFLPSILSELISMRNKLKEDNNDKFLVARADTLKLLANSFYGYLGFYGARWYSIESANCVTAWGRYYIKKVISDAEDSGFDVLYSDTDSIFLALREKKESHAIDFMKYVNSQLPDEMELEYEGFYKRGLFVGAKEKTTGAKKKYALLLVDDSIKIRGFESVRGNFSEIGKEVQRKVIETVLKERDDSSALKYLNLMIKSLKNKEVDNKKTIIETTLSKEIEKYDSAAPHVEAAKRMKALGRDVSPGTKIRYIVGEGEGRIGERARLPEEMSQGDYDSEYYINNQVVPSVEKIFELFGKDKDILIGDKGQKKLGDF